MKQTSTAISDLVLAIISFFCLNTLQSQRYGTFLIQFSSWQLKYASTGFAFVYVAALLGVFRFGLSNPPDALLKSHAFFSWIATVVGVPLIASEYHIAYSPHKQYAVAFWIGSLVSVAIWSFLSLKTQEIVSLLLSSACLFSIILNCTLHSANVWGLSGAFLVAVSGLILSNNRAIFNYPAVDWFHYIFAVAVACLTKGLL